MEREREADEVRSGGRWMGGLEAGEVQGGGGTYLQGRESWEGGPAGSMGRLYEGLSEEVYSHQIAAALLP